jgi:hypothetical protein
MKFWISPFIGTMLAGAYGALSLHDDWFIGGERAFRASGKMLAYVIVGSALGAIISVNLFPKAPN